MLEQLNVALQPVEIDNLEDDATGSQAIDGPSQTRQKACPPVLKPPSIAPPTLQAQHNEPHSLVGTIMIGDAGNVETCVPVNRSRGSDRGNAKRKRKCTNCKQNGGMDKYECGG